MITSALRRSYLFQLSGLAIDPEYLRRKPSHQFLREKSTKHSWKMCPARWPFCICSGATSSMSIPLSIHTGKCFSPPRVLIIFDQSSTGSPAAYRPITARLAGLTRGRTLNVGYRLAPQNPFPAAVLDTLVAYLSLLYPPDLSHHEPIPASSIIFAGDSAGGSLCLSLVQLILSAQNLQKTKTPTVLFHGRDVELSLPAGLALLSVAPDQTASLPSWTVNADSDIFEDKLPALDPKYPTCALWPTNPPRGNLYCETPMLNHPLVSPVTAKAGWDAPRSGWLLAAVSA